MKSILLISGGFGRFHRFLSVRTGLKSKLETAGLLLNALSYLLVAQPRPNRGQSISNRPILMRYNL